MRIYRAVIAATTSVIAFTIAFLSIIYFSGYKINIVGSYVTINSSIQKENDSLKSENTKYVQDRTADILTIAQQQDSITVLNSINKGLRESGERLQLLSNNSWSNYQTLRDSINFSNRKFILK